MVQSFERGELLIVELPYRDCNEFDNNLFFFRFRFYLKGILYSLVQLLPRPARLIMVISMEMVRRIMLRMQIYRHVNEFMKG